MATSSGEAQRSIPTPFLTKTYQIVDDSTIDDVISWNEDGSAFVVWNPTIFARDLLPKHFKHNNLSSFVRQLNTYGFRKVAPDRWEFANESFRRGEKRLLGDIQRRKASMAQSPHPPTTAVTVTAIPITPPSNVSPSVSSDEQVISYSPPVAIPTSSCSNNNSNGRVDLTDENERLKKENLQLNRELSNMKSLCGNIFALMSNYGNPQTSNAEAEMLKPLELLRDDVAGGENAVEMAEVSVGSQTRLFGFEIGSKRAREEIGGCGSGSGSGSMQLDEAMTMDMEVKSEPFDSSSEELDDNDGPWIKRVHRQKEKKCH